jgi:hypothetical protein
VDRPTRSNSASSRHRTASLTVTRHTLCAKREVVENSRTARMRKVDYPLPALLSDALISPRAGGRLDCPLDFQRTILPAEQASMRRIRLVLRRIAAPRRNMRRPVVPHKLSRNLALGFISGEYRGRNLACHGQHEGAPLHAVCPPAGGRRKSPRPPCRPEDVREEVRRVETASSARPRGVSRAQAYRTCHIAPPDYRTCSLGHRASAVSSD